MNMNQPTIIKFEEERRKCNLIPPLQSNSFYTIGDGEINLYCIRNDINNYRFDLTINSGEVYTGFGNLYISGDTKNINQPYRNLYITKNSILKLNQSITISKGEFKSSGTLELLQYSKLFITNKASVVFDNNSKLIISEQSGIIVDQGSTLTIYGDIFIHIAKLNSILNNPNIIIDSSAVLNVTGINYENKTFDLVQYDNELKSKNINVDTQGEKNYNNGKSRVGYKWLFGNPLKNCHAVELSLLLGEHVLGDFRLSVTGIPLNIIDNTKSIANLTIKENTILYITEKYNDSTYIRPELYLGININNTSIPAECKVFGHIICDGINSKITVDRGAKMVIEDSGIVELKNGSILKSTYNESNINLIINGKLIIDDISQINTLTNKNISFGENGKLIILNPDTGTKRLLFTTPKGILNSDLYRIFLETIDHIEYHISNNTGIGIDTYFDSYEKQMTNWFGNRRIEKAIKDKIIVWHDGGFIELYSNITPWANKDATLLKIGRLFKTFGSFDKDKLQDAVNRLIFAGCGNILFRFIDGDNINELPLMLQSIKLKNCYNNPRSNSYNVTTNSDGILFLRNNASNSNIDTLINNKSKMVDIIDNEAIFSL